MSFDLIYIIIVNTMHNDPRRKEQNTNKNSRLFCNNKS